jgi:hypothetical protein
LIRQPIRSSAESARSALVDGQSDDTGLGGNERYFHWPEDGLRVFQPIGDQVKRERQHSAPGSSPML